jgi:hypothetical protein
VYCAPLGNNSMLYLNAINIPTSAHGRLVEYKSNGYNISILHTTQAEPNM